ncbi:MAG TPA: transcriptional regulator [Gammaproteobacteria bacterium]|nr:transcriptional regulator [Gammaproteobacteria bacterium]
MGLSRSFKETVRARALKDPAFRRALLEESMNEFLSGDLEVAKSLLRDYINAGPSFQRISKLTKINDKSLQRMLSDKGNPTTSNFCIVLHAIQEIEGVEIGARIRR